MIMSEFFYLSVRIKVMKKLLNSQKGFSFPELLVAMGLVGGVSLVTMKLVETNSRNQSTLTATSEIQKTVSLVKQALGDPEGCRYVLRGQAVGNNGSPVNIGANPQNAALGAGLFFRIARTNDLKVLLRPNTTYRGFRSTTIQLQRPAGNLPDSAELILNFANETTLDKNQAGTLSDGNAANDKGTRMVIPLMVKLDGSNQVTDCGPSTSETNEAAREKFCLSLGTMAIWDSLGNPKTCKFRTYQCPHGQVAREQLSTGAITCVNVEDQMRASDLFDTTPCSITGNYQIIKVGDKLKIQCN
jgi:prepilin-type N-terminal cleavage/methylation domain-containing protein